ncbi:hypothetical protein BC833DRAFT_569592 [Globomyces pollinis-pini]|nr:hypothetical protein BC833DRAFT_569592 [Globomyces pollinis-pini]
MCHKQLLNKEQYPSRIYKKHEKLEGGVLKFRKKMMVDKTSYEHEDSFHDDMDPIKPEAPVVITKYGDEKEQRLAEYVTKMNEDRSKTGVQGFKNNQRIQMEELFNGMLAQSRTIESNIFIGETEIFKRNEDAFYTTLNELEVVDLKARQAIETQALKLRHEQNLKDFNARKDGKKFQRSQARELKDLYHKTQYRDDMFKNTESVKAALRSHRERTAKVVEHIEERHLKQIKLFNDAEEREYTSQKILIGLQCQALDEETRSETMKKFQSKMNHQKVLSKKRLDHIREQQRLELRQFKEVWELETRKLEELANMKETQGQFQQDFLQEQRSEIIVEKERISEAQKNLKIFDIKAEQNLEKAKAKAIHRNQIRELIRSQRARKEKRHAVWSAVIDKNDAYQAAVLDSIEGSRGTSKSTSTNQSTAHSRKTSDANLSKKAFGVVNEGETEERQFANQVTSNNEVKEVLKKLQAGLLELKKKHEVAYFEMTAKLVAAYKEKEEQFEKELVELEMKHDIEKKRLVEDCEAEIEESLKIQEREREMEGHIRQAETKALIERKVLNSLLSTFVDGVISIDPLGFIQRFNAAAEKMFGYTAAEVIEGKFNIKQLMPKRFSENHDTYLYNYYSTGVKKVIGSGRHVYGLKRDGTEFPLHLSISEVLEDGFHLFTAIARDITEMVEEENYKQSTETQMMWRIDNAGKVLSLNQKFKKYAGITKPEEEATADVCSPGMVHPQDLQASLDKFAEGRRTKKPFEIKRRLKGVDGHYRWFLTSALPVFSTHGEFKFWVGGCTDIDDAEILNAELTTMQEDLPVFLWKYSAEQAAKEMQILPECLPQKIWKIDTFGKVLYCNQNFLKFVGATKGTELNVFDPSVVHPDDLQASLNAFKKGNEEKKQFVLRRRLKSHDGKYCKVVTTGNPIIDGTGAVTGWYGTCADD